MNGINFGIIGIYVYIILAIILGTNFYLDNSRSALKNSYDNYIEQSLDRVCGEMFLTEENNELIKYGKILNCSEINKDIYDIFINDLSKKMKTNSINIPAFIAVTNDGLYININSGSNRKWLSKVNFIDKGNLLNIKNSSIEEKNKIIEIIKRNIEVYLESSVNLPYASERYFSDINGPGIIICYKIDGIDNKEYISASMLNMSSKFSVEDNKVIKGNKYKSDIEYYDELTDVLQVKN